MFEIGKTYYVWMIEDGVETQFTAGKVIEVHLPLVKFQASAIAGGGETIINTASANFVKAKDAETAHRSI